MIFLAEILKQFWAGFLDFIYPPICLLCGESCEEIICSKCRAKLVFSESCFCLECGEHISTQEFRCSKSHSKSDTSLDFVCPISPFDEFHRKLIHMLKYDGMITIAEFYGKRIGEFLLSHKDFENWDVLIPVPLHKSRQRERRYNQAELIAKTVSKYFNIPVQSNIVKRIRNTRTQTALSAKQRKTNVSGAFAVESNVEIAGSSIILIDDVVTTGATMTEIARILIKSGAERICAVCIAHPEHNQSKLYGI